MNSKPKNRTSIMCHKLMFLLNCQHLELHI